MLCGPKNNQINKELKEELLVFLEEKLKFLHSGVVEDIKTRQSENLNGYAAFQRIINLLNKEYPNYPEQPYMVDTIDRVSYACPSQWIGKTKCGKEIYCRYRGGKFSLEINNATVHHIRLRNDPEVSLEDFLKGQDDPIAIEQKTKQWETEMYFRKINGGEHSYHGLLSNNEMMEVTKGFLDFSQSFTNFEVEHEYNPPGIINVIIKAEDIK